MDTLALPQMGKAVALFLALYVALPASLLRAPGDDGWDRCWRGLAAACAAVALTVHVLALVRLYELLSLVSALGYAGVTLALRRSGRLAAEGKHAGVAVVAAGLLNLADRLNTPGEWRRMLAAGLAAVARAARGALLRLKWRELARAAIVAGVIGAAATLRFAHAWQHAYLGASDGYVHLARIKYLEAGQFYAYGIYPLGYHSIASALGLIGSIDRLLVLRVLGPLAGTLLVASVFYAARAWFGFGPAVAAAALFGLSTGSPFPSVPWRQISALPQEFSSLFLLPGLVFWHRYLRGGRAADLLTSAACAFLTVVIHPYAGAFLGLGAALQAIWHVALGGAMRRALLALAASAVGAVVAVMPMLIARLMGTPWEGSSIEYAKQSAALSVQADAGSLVTGWRSLIDPNPFLTGGAALALALLCCAAACDLARRGERRHGPLAWLAASTLLSYVLYRAPEIGLPSPMAQFRAGFFFSLLVAPLFAGAARLLDELAARRAAAGTLAALALVGAILWRWPPVAPQGDRYEYDAAVNTYLRIRQELPRLEWTIVGPTQQYGQALGSGWHFDLVEFLQRFSLEQAADPRFEVPFPTPWVFLFAEKRPLGLDRDLREEDADDPAPLAAKTGDERLAVYSQPALRRALEARALRWAKTFLAGHPDARVFYEDDQFVAFQIKSPGRQREATGFLVQPAGLPPVSGERNRGMWLVGPALALAVYWVLRSLGRAGDVRNPGTPGGM